MKVIYLINIFNVYYLRQIRQIEFDKTWQNYCKDTDMLYIITYLCIT